MRAFQNYFVFIISTLGLILGVSGDDHDEFKIRMLILHNLERPFHKAPTLQWDNELANKAQVIAEHWISTNENLQNKDSSYNYNIYSVRLIGSAKPLKLNPHTVFLYWYQTLIPYNYKEEPQTKDFDAFTQIVWKETQFLGVAKVEKDGKSVVVATYSPAGNIKGEYENNVEERI